MTIADLIARWTGTEGGAERANYQMFLSEFAQALGLPAPLPKGAGLGEYEFEAPVRSEAALGRKGTGRIDLYKRNCFILEAKQSQLKPGEIAPAEPAAPAPEPLRDLFGNIIGYDQPPKAVPRYDRLMADARLQAERYAMALPGDHKAPPFLIVADIGRAFELYFDWAGNGRGYSQFPDERHYRIALGDLASDAKIEGLDRTAADVLRAIWTAPETIDPRLRAAKVTRDIAERLSRVAAALEEDQRRLRPGDTEIALGIEATSLFLMRMLFCMFAEDVGLLPKDSFKQFLGEATAKSDLFWRNGLTDLWSKMNSRDEINRFWLAGDAVVRYFNGNLFSSVQIYDLAPEFKRELLVAAGKDWRAVEPAIFGTLLEQVLTAKDRAKLGAHYTPRAYVERLVQATIMDVLAPEWEAVLARARARADAGDSAGAIGDATAFHRRLVALRVLDPACGTGNFLYVAMDALLRLESEVRQFVVGLGGTLDPAVHPNQFLGLELNPRAAVIAELVLWIGWLRHRLANTPDAIGEPVLPPLRNINEGTHGGYDAVLALLPTGAPDLANPRRPDWPAADFIVGNPPFIGKGSIIREALGDDYLSALWAANPRMPKSADFVMHWWDRAADILTRPGTRLRRFGFVTTNSITQVFSRRVIEGWLAPASPSPDGEGLEKKLHLVLAIPDHPWTRVTKDAAAVRIAMTVAQAGAGTGRQVRIVRERAIDTDAPELEEAVSYGAVNADLSVGTDVTSITSLEANAGLSSNGFLLAGAGFILTPQEAKTFVDTDGPSAERIIRPYLGGGEVVQRPRGRYIIDFKSSSEREARQSAPSAYDHLLQTVYTQRRNTASASSSADARDYFARWWQFAKQRPGFRQAVAELDRYIVTVETSKHRIFRFVGGDVAPDHMVIAIASDDLLHLASAILSNSFGVGSPNWRMVGCRKRQSI